MEQQTLGVGLRTISFTSIWLEEMISTPSNTYPSSSKGQLVTASKASPKAPLEVGKSSKMLFGQIFKGLMSDLPDTDDLSHITQQPGESARKLWNMFLTKKNQIVDCPDAKALAAFKHNVQDEWLARHLGQEKPRTMAALTSLMTRFCAGEDSWLAQCNTSDPSTSEDRDGNGKPRRSKNKRRNKEDSPKSTAINAGFRSSRPGQQKLPSKGNRDKLSSLNKILDKIC